MEARQEWQSSAVLARRLVLSLDGPNIAGLITALGGQEKPIVAGSVHPLHYYVIPPLSGVGPLAGDIYHGKVNQYEGYWVILTPSCDFPVRNGKTKAEWVLFARCILLTECAEYISWKGAEEQAKKTKKNLLEQLVKNNRSTQPERYYYLPAAFTLPDMIIDFQQTERLDRDQLDKLTRTASLDSPFAEALLARFSRYLGRIGTPDLDNELIMKRLTTDT